MSTTDSTAGPGTPVTVTIRSIGGRELFVSTQTTVAAALREAIAASADLRYANLRSANLRYANLRYADLSYADLSSANLRYADLRYANLSSADLSSANLSSADLRYANLRSANPRYANLSSADLRYANLRGSRTVLSVTGLPSGHAILAPLPDGWRLTIGCWSGSVDALRQMIATDDQWPESRGAQIVERRPMLAALADMCDAWSTANALALQQVQDKWGTKAAVAE